MIRALMTKELMNAVLDRKYPVYFVLVVGLAVLSFVLQAGEYGSRRSNYLRLDDSFIRSAEQAQNIFQLAFGGMRVAVPPVPLQALCRGTAVHPSEFANICLSPDSKEPFPFLRTEENVNAAQGLFPALDFPFIIMFIASLVVLVFSHNTVSHEQESGTLRLMLSYRVSRAGVILAKTASGYLVTAFPVVFSLVSVLLAAELLPAFSVTAQTAVRICAVGAASLLYLLVLYLLGVFVSTVCRRSATAIAVLLLVWLVFIIVTHNAGIMAFERSADSGSIGRVLERNQQQRALERLKRDMEQAIKDVLKVEKVTKDTWKGVTPEQQTEIGLTQVAILDKFVSSSVAEYVNDLERNYRRLRLTGYLSPSLLYLSTATELAGTGVNAHIGLMRSLLDYQHYFRTVIEDGIRKMFDPENKDRKGPPPSPYKEMRPYRVPEPSLSGAWSTVWPQTLALCVYAVLFFLMGFTAFIKKEIT